MRLVIDGAWEEMRFEGGRLSVSVREKCDLEDRVERTKNIDGVNAFHPFTTRHNTTLQRLDTPKFQDN